MSISLKKSIWLPLLAVCCFFSQSAEAQDTIGLGLGVGVAVSTSEYKGMDADVLPFPIICYEGDHLFVRDLSAGVFLFRNQQHEVAASVSYMPHSFDASKSDTHAMRQLDDRHSTAMAGVSYKLTTDWGVAEVGASADILGKSDGFLVNAYYSYPITFSNVTVAPKVGLLWADENFNDYYYGVSSKEARKSGYKEYNAKSGFTTHIGLDAYVKVTDDWSFFVSGNALVLSDEVRDSPMVDKRVKYSAATGVAYSF